MKTLFDKTTFAGLEVKNRLRRSATCEKMADEKGHMTEQLYSLYENLAKGGVGLIITGFANIIETEQPTERMMGIYSDDFIPKYQKLTDLIHKHDTKIFMQIVYGGSQTNYNTETREIWGPSNIPHAFFETTPTEMTKADIDTLTNAFAEAALRVKQAGFDGVQLHGAHGYLLSQFLTPYYNKRTDEYGGSIENRGRIIYETLDKVREKVGPDYPVTIKMHGSDHWGEAGLTPEESLTVAKELEKRGISGIEFSGGHFSADSKKVPAMIGLSRKKRQCYFKDEVIEIAKELKVPVALVGGNRDVDYMEEILNSSNISYFSLSRTLLSEPELPNKWLNGFRDKPRCISCNKCFADDVNICFFDR